MNSLPYPFSKGGGRIIFTAPPLRAIPVRKYKTAEGKLPSAESTIQYIFNVAFNDILHLLYTVEICLFPNLDSNAVLAIINFIGVR